MEAANCAECKSQARLQCARCKNISYCSKDCQILHWQTHKKTCAASVKSPEDIKSNYVKYANNRIVGNILIMAAHRYKTHGRGVIFAEITETIEEFMKGGSLHFAHLQFVPRCNVNEVATTKFGFNPINVDEFVTNEESVNVVYCFNNYHFNLNIKPETLTKFESLVSEHPNPDDVWSVIFEL